MLRSQMEQELFRALSNRTRTKPNEIYSKLTSQIVGLQQQIVHFNQLESQIPNWLKRETNKLGGQPKNLSLKMMTQPKYENLLINCELPQGDKQNLKNNKMARKLSQKANIKNILPNIYSNAKILTLNKQFRYLKRLDLSFNRIENI